VLRGWLVVFATASACGGQPRAPAAALEGRLGAIRIVGNHAIASDALEPALALHEAIGDGAAADPYLLTLDTERIRAAYLKRGFFAATVTPSVETRPSGAQVAVFTVVEGRRAATRVAITGLPPELAPGAARALVELADGAPFDYDRYDAAKAPLAQLLENAGYARAEVRGRVDADPAGAVATVRYEMAPGPLCRFGRIDLAGARDDLEPAVRARLRFATGDRYSAAALAASQGDIYELGRFSTVHVVADPSGDGTDVGVTVELTEASRYEVHAGFGFGVEPVTYEARVRGGGSLVPAAAPLITAAADARVAVTILSDYSKLEPKVRVIGSLQRIDLWWPRLRGELEGGIDYQTVEAYTWTGVHVRLGLASPLGPSWLQARVGWLLEGLSFDKFVTELDGDANRPAREALGLEGAHRLGAYQASLIADLRDDPIEPHRGGYFAFTASLGGAYAGGDMDYVQLMPELRGYLPIAGFVAAARARLGTIYAGDGGVPAIERYYSGGTTGQRGFSERYLAPRVDATLTGGCANTGKSTVIGGAGLIETGVELRRQLASIRSVPVGTTLFLDGASVTCQPEELHPTELQWATGAGIWAKLAGLKIHVDVGYRLNGPDLNGRELSPGPGAFGNFAWHIGVGETY
jgi:outer membrane protein assembly factor BamA